MATRSRSGAVEQELSDLNLKVSGIQDQVRNHSDEILDSLIETRGALRAILMPLWAIAFGIGVLVWRAM